MGTQDTRTRGLISKYCKACDHLSVDCCLFILAKKGRRPCPAGDGCTEHTKKKGKMMAEKTWNMETAARLLQYGVAGKVVAEAVGTYPSEISKHKDTLLSMVVEPLTDREVEALLRKMTPEERADHIVNRLVASDRRTELTEPVTPDQARAETAKAAEAVQTAAQNILAMTEGMVPPKKPDVVVNIDIGKGKVHLEAEDAKVLETLINMLFAMTGRV